MLAGACQACTLRQAGAGAARPGASPCPATRPPIRPSICALQEIKKSKEFEVRKILRRIKQAKEGGAKGEDLAVGLVCLQWALKPFSVLNCMQQAYVRA